MKVDLKMHGAPDSICILLSQNNTYCSFCSKSSLNKCVDFIPTTLCNINFLGYIDLSKRRVNAEDVERSTEKFSKAKAVNSILRHVAELLEYESSEQLEELYKKTAWRYEEKTKKHASSYEFFKQACM